MARAGWRLLASLVVLLLSSLANAGDVLWAIVFSGATGSRANGIAVNPLTGDSHVIGTFKKRMKIGSFNLTANGTSDVFMATIGPAGVVSCAVNFDGVNVTQGLAVAVDRDGSTYNTGYFRGTINMGSLGTLVNDGVQDIFLIKLNASTCVPDFARRYGGLGNNQGNGVTVDRTERPYICGAFQGNMSFVDSGFMGNFTLVSDGPNSDFFLLRIGQAGRVLWGKSYGSVGVDYAKGVATDDAHNSYATGSYQYQLATQDTPPILHAVGVRDVVIMKHDNLGNLTWARSYGSVGGVNIGRAIATDGAGNSYTTGVFQNRMAVGATTLVAWGKDDGFVIKLAPDGQEVWAVGFGGRGDDEGYSIALDPSAAYLYVCGTFQLTMTVNKNVLTTGDLDAFVLKMSTVDGQLIWGREIGNAGYNHAYGVSCDMLGNPIVVGDFERSLDVGDGVVLVATGKENYFILKLSATSSILIGDWQPSYLKVTRRPRAGNATRLLTAAGAAASTAPGDSWSFRGRMAVPSQDPLFAGATNRFKFLVLLLDGNNVDYYSSVRFDPGQCVGTTNKRNRTRFVCSRAASTNNSAAATLKFVEVKQPRSRAAAPSLRVYKLHGKVKHDDMFPIPEAATLQVVLDFTTAVYWQPRPLLPCKHKRERGAGGGSIVRCR